MKNSLLLLILFYVITTAFQKGTQVIDVRDMRYLGFNHSIDTVTVGHHLDDVYINKVVGQGDGTYARHDSLDLYNIHFIKNYNGHLKNYLLLYDDTVTSYNKAFCQWLNDTVLSIRFVDTGTGKQTKAMHILQIGNKAEIDSKIYGK